MAKIGILGAGTWGIALARMLSNSGHDVTVWSAISSEIDYLNKTHVHKYLPGMQIPESVALCKELGTACSNKEIIIFAVPSLHIRSTVQATLPYINDGQILIDVAKGIEPETLYTMTQVIQSQMTKAVKIVALSGPTHAEEVAKDMPTTIVAACNDLSIAELVQKIFANTCIRVYTNPDVIGVELCGAIKNIIALAAGISTGLGYGDNARAALITRGMAEICKLGKKMGCLQQTFSGLAGIGDLIVTATSMHSRNNRCGILIGQGMGVAEAVKQIGMVVEGINALPATMRLMHRYNVEMPITTAVNSIVNDGANPQIIVNKLMTREQKCEISDYSISFRNTLEINKRSSSMKRVITYGTFDLLHYGHINLLRRAKALGDYLIVVLSSDEFNWNEKHKKTYFSYEERKALLESVRYVDLVIPEESWNQKRSDMHEYHINTFVMGDDWKGKFDFLKQQGVDVIYLPRTPQISTSKIKKDLYDANAVDSVSKTNHDDINTDPLGN